MKIIKPISTAVALCALIFSSIVTPVVAKSSSIVDRSCSLSKFCCKKTSTDCLSLVDVNVPLHVERDQFGRPTVVGTPKKGPKHGIGSYWYQVGKMWAEADSENNFVVTVYSYLKSAGRLSEFIVDNDPFSTDVHARRVTMTTPQYEQQLVDDADKYPKDIIDFIDGMHQGFLNYIIKIQNGEQPLPADFVSNEFGDVGILNWFWSDVQNDFNVARKLFTVVNYIRGLEITNDLYGSTVTAFDQVAFGVNFGQFIATAVAQDEGVPTIEAIQLTNDILGVPEYNFRFTVKEGDRGGIYCPKGANTCAARDSATIKRIASIKPVSSFKKLREKHSVQFEQFKQNKKNGGISRPKKRHLSDFLMVSSRLTKDKSIMMFGNSQLNWGFDGGGDGGFFNFRFRYNTPKGAYYSPSWAPSYTRSQTGYAVHYSPEITQVGSRDGIFEDSTNLVLIYTGTSTDIENVPGGKEQSTIKVRLADGTVDEFFVTIYQGNPERPGLELDIPLFFPPDFDGSSRVPDPDNPDNEFLVITRHPCDWMHEVAGYLQGTATWLGMVPFDNVKEFAENLSTNPLVFMLGGLDSKGNIFAISSGLYPTIVPINNPPLNRILAGDATNTQYFSQLCARPLPYVDNVNYRYDCRGSQVVKNPSCGFITGWNNIWANDSQQAADTSGQELHRVGSIFYNITTLVDEKGKLEYNDIRNLWTSLNLQRTGAEVFGFSFGVQQNYEADGFPIVFRDALFDALNAKGLLVGLTQHEIDRTLELLGPTYDGRSIPNVDINDRLNGLNYDGRWVLSQLWISILNRNIWEAGIPDQVFREEVAFNLAIGDLSITEPSADWSQDDPFQSRVSGCGILSSSDYNNQLLLRILKIGPDLGNALHYDWYGNILASIGVDLLDPDQRQEFIAQALKDALEFQVTGSNAGTGLEDPVTGRANLDLIQDDGIPLHPGWGKGQRPVTLDGPPYATEFLVDNIQLLSSLPTLNSQGQLFYAQRDCDGCLKHFQSVSQVGYSSLITNDVINEENVVTVQPHAIDQSIYFRGNFETDEIPFDIKKKGNCSRK